MDDYALNPTAVARSFGRAASGYRNADFLQREVAGRLLEQLPESESPPLRVLDLGCGPAIDAAGFAQRWPGVQCIALDLALPMLKSADPGSELAPVCADAHRLPIAARSIDLVWSNLALQWCDDLGAVLTELRRVLRPEGRLLFSTFGPDTLAELRAAWKAVDDRVHVHGFSDMHDIGDALLQAGFVDPVMSSETIEVTYPKLNALLRDLKAIGATNVAAGRRRGLTGRGRFAALEKAYEHFRRNDVLPASWEVLYGFASGPQPGAPRKTAEGDVATFSPEDLLGSLKK